MPFSCVLGMQIAKMVLAEDQVQWQCLVWALLNLQVQLLNRGLFGKKNTTDTRYIQKPSFSYIYYVSFNTSMFQLNFNINIWSSDSHTSEDTCLLDTMLQQWSCSHIYKDKTGFAYMVKKSKEDPRRLGIYNFNVTDILCPAAMQYVIFVSYKL
jgi:hypothetical protein